jgi:hypothetical protein
MPDMPRHPETQDTDSAQEAGPAASRPVWVYALAAVVVALLVLMVVLHLAGVIGPGSH